MTLKELWQNIGREAFWLILGHIISALGGLFAIRMLTGYFSREVYGLSWLFINGVTLIAMVFAHPLAQAVRRFYHEEERRNRLDALLGMVWRFQLWITCGLTILYAIIVFFFGYAGGENKVSLLIMPAYFFSLASITIAQALLNTSRKRGSLVALSLPDAWLKPLGALALCIIWKPSVDAFVLGYALSTILTGAAGMVWINRYGSASLFRQAMPDTAYVRQVLPYILPWIGLAGFNWMLSLSDRYIVNMFLGEALTGTYVASYQVGSAPFQFLGGVFGFLVQPIIFQYSSMSVKKGAEKISSALVAFAWISVPMLAAFIIMHQWLMRWLVAPAFWSGVDAIVWIGLGIYMWVFGNIVMNALLVMKQTMPLLKISALAAGINIGLNLLLVPRWGIAGAGISTFLAYAFNAAALLYAGKQALEWRFPWQSYWIALLIAGSAGLAGKLAHLYLFESSYTLMAFAGVSSIFLIVTGTFIMLFKNRVTRDYQVMVSRV
ncbi:MAG: polysaccharide biosynthesis C-terminal domain-containing protein [Nitrospirota bacterium]